MSKERISERPASAEIGALLRILEAVLEEAPDGDGGAMADDPAFRRRVALLKVGFEALRALELRVVASGTDVGLGEEPPAAGCAGNALAAWSGDAALIIDIRRAELRLAISHLAIEALAYQALPMPDEHRGENEPPVGSVHTQLSRRVMLANLFADADTLDAHRDRLARRLFKP